jgi:hypothetical protein
MMEYRPIQSSSVLLIGYDVEIRALQVTFTSGRTYIYDQVPKNVADAFLNAKSKGQFVATELRDKYTYRCLNPKPVETNRYDFIKRAVIGGMSEPEAQKSWREKQEAQGKSAKRRKARGEKLPSI